MQPSFDSTDVGTSEGLSCVSAELPSVRFVWSLRVICAAALAISVYLAWTAFSMVQVFGCSGGELIDCAHVMKSHWSKVMGIPVSVPAAGLYASLIALLAFARRDGPRMLQHLVWGGMTLGSVMAGLAALWFIGLQIFLLEHYCPYCLVVHACGIALACTMLASPLCPSRLKLKSAGISFLGVAALVLIQCVTPKADQFEVIVFAPVEQSDTNEESAIDGNELDVVEPPANILEAPGEAFPAPGEVFEAPTFGDVAADPDNAGTKGKAIQKSGESKDSKVNDEQPSVASTLLLVVPPRLMQLGNLVLALSEANEESAETPTEATTDVTAKPSQDSTAASDEESDSENEVDATKSEAETTEATQKPAAEASKPVERRLLTFAGNKFTLDIKQWPLLGKTDAKYVFVEMFDYTCPHCRNTHLAILGAQKQHGNDLAIFALPVPLDIACNPAAGGGNKPGACEMAKIAVAVWRLDPEKFQTFHDWMFKQNRTAASALQHAETLVDKNQLKAELSSEVPGQYISRHVSLYQRVGSGQVPKLIFPTTMMQGEVNSTKTICDAIQRELGGVKN